MNGTYQGEGTDYDVIERQSVCYIQANGYVTRNVAKRVKLLQLNDEEIELNAACFGAFPFPSQPLVAKTRRKKLLLGYEMLCTRVLDTYVQLKNSGRFVSAHHLVPAFSTLIGRGLSLEVLPNIAREYRMSNRPLQTKPLQTLCTDDIDDCENDRRLEKSASDLDEARS